jgi:catechol 2,3-dioxygenase-like lactoylglutathione lyase family enzyme
MEPQIFSITLAVRDLDASLAFYRDGLGLPTSGIIGEEFVGTDTEAAGRVAMFQLRDNLTLSLYPATELAKDAGVSSGYTTGHGFSLGHQVASPDEVDRILEAARMAGAHVVGSVGKRPWGIYSGYFTDPDGHLWEVVCFLNDPQ